MRSTTHIIDNLSTSLNSNTQSFMSMGANAESTPATNDSPIIDISSGLDASNLPEDLKSFEKPSYKTDMKNFVASKKHGTKHVEKTKLFGFNKRQPIYEQEEFDMMCETSNFSTIFFEVNDSCMTSSKLDNSKVSPRAELTEAKQHRDICKSMDDLQQKGGGKANMCQKLCSSTDNLKFTELKDSPNESLHCLDSLQNISDSRNSLLKRKGICSSQEMLHLVDIMSDNISPEQVDVLAKSLIELGGAESLKTESEHELQDLDHQQLLERLPEIIDDKLLENIDAAIYENQIIFQERIRKNQLTIQNLKLQDQMLSKYIEDFKVMPGADGMSIRDYENMCFGNITQDNRGIKHWKNYLHDIDTKQHDDSTIQHSSFYMNTNTMSNSFTDLYINENDLGFNSMAETSAQFNDKNMSTLVEDGTNTDSITSPDLALNSGDDEGVLIPHCKKIERWEQHKLPNETNRNLIKYICDDSSLVGENFYMNMTKGTKSNDTGDGARFVPPHDQCQKNILVETINKINIVDSPIKHV